MSLLSAALALHLAVLSAPSSARPIALGVEKTDAGPWSMSLKDGGSKRAWPPDSDRRVTASDPACAGLQGRDIALDVDPKFPFGFVAPGLEAARDCGAARVLLQRPKGAPLPLAFEGAAAAPGPIVLVSISGKLVVVFHGEAAEVDPSARAHVEALKALAGSSALSLIPSARSPLSALTAAAAAFSGASVSAVLNPSKELSGGLEIDRRIVRAALGEAGALADATVQLEKPTGALVRRFGVAKAPVRIEVARPPWVQMGAVACKTPEGVMVYGAGFVSGMANASFAMTTAESRARREISQRLSEVSRPPGRLAKAVPGFTDNVLKGSEIVGRWSNPIDGTAHALARMPAPKSMPAQDDPRCKLVNANPIKEVGLSFRPIDPDGGTGTARPPWAASFGLDVGSDGALAYVQAAPGRMGSEEGFSSAEQTAKKRLVEILGRAAARAAKADKAASCLARVRFDALAAGAAVERWWNTPAARAMVRARIAPEALASTLESAACKSAQVVLAEAPRAEVDLDREASTTFLGLLEEALAPIKGKALDIAPHKVEPRAALDPIVLRHQKGHEAAELASAVRKMLHDSAVRLEPAEKQPPLVLTIELGIEELADDQGQLGRTFSCSVVLATRDGRRIYARDNQVPLLEPPPSLPAL